MAALLITLAIIPVFGALTASLLALEDSVVITIASNLLQDRSEVLKAAGYDLIPVGEQWLADYEGRPFDIRQVVTQVAGMVDANGVSQVKKVVLTIYRSPRSASDDALGSWEFLVYAQGL